MHSMQEGDAIDGFGFVARENGGIEELLGKSGTDIGSSDVLERSCKASADLGQESHREGGPDLADLVSIFEKLDEGGLQPHLMALIQAPPKFRAGSRQSTDRHNSMALANIVPLLH
jgi:hypothetical protein